MSIAKALAVHFRQVYFGGNWTAVNLQATLADVSLDEANTRISGLHTIAELVYHLHYYVYPVCRVLQGGRLEASDSLSFQLPPLNTPAQWQDLTEKVFQDARMLAGVMEQLDDAQLFEVFADPKYGDFFRNLQGITEHTHYHLGQIVLLKKIIRDRDLSAG